MSGAGVGAVGLALAQVNPDAQVVLLEKNAAAAALRPRKYRAQRAGGARPGRSRPTCSTPRRARRKAWSRRPISSSPIRLSSRAGEARRLARSRPRHGPCAGRGRRGKMAARQPRLLRPGRSPGRHSPRRRAGRPARRVPEAGWGICAWLPVFPTEGEKATRVILRGRKGSKAPLALLPGLVLHEAGRTLHRASGRDPPPRPADFPTIEQKAGPKAGFRLSGLIDSNSARGASASPSACGHARAGCSIGYRPGAA